MIKKYKIGFDIWGLIIFIVIMIPNFIWFAVPAPNDILRGESITKTVDVIASICQVLMVMSLCIFINQERKKISITRFIITTIICCVLYFLCWVFYDVGVSNAIALLGLTIFPFFICNYFYGGINKHTNHKYYIVTFH